MPGMSVRVADITPSTFAGHSVLCTYESKKKRLEGFTTWGCRR